MARSKELVRLPGTSHGVAAVRQLWLGRGFLLLVERSAFRELYTRVALADVQAFIVRRTRAFEVRLGVWSITLLISVSLALAGADVGRVVWTTLAVVIALVGVVDAAAGPGCRVHLRTPVQIVELPSLRRWRRARKVIGRLRPLIEERQDAVATGELRYRLAEVAPLPPPPSGIRP